MEPSDQELYDQLLGYLAAGGEVDERADEGVVSITRYGHRVLGEPLRLHIDAAALGRQLRDGAPDATGLYPDVPPLDAAWRLFTVHLDEAVRSARPGETELVLQPGGVGSVRADGSRVPLAPPVQAHIARDRYAEDLLQHLADRGDVEIHPWEEVVVVHRLDGRQFHTPWNIHLPSEEFGRQIETGPRGYREMVDELERLLADADPQRSTIALTPAGFALTPR